MKCLAYTGHAPLSSGDLMMQTSDETLMALADGELSAEEAARVQKAVDADPDLQQRLRQFTETRKLLGALRPVGEQVSEDDPLVAMIRKAQTAPAQPAPQAIPPQPAPANLNRRPWLAIAASVALAVVAVGWLGFNRDAGLSTPEIAALDQLPSGESQHLADGRTLTMIASYRADDLCREYEISEGGRAAVTLACRDGKAWQPRFTAEVALDADGYLPASGEIEGLDAALGTFGSPLTPEEEAAALRE